MADQIDLSKVVELSYTRLANLLLDGGAPKADIDACVKIEDLYRLAPFYLTKKPSNEADALVLFRKWIGRADPASVHPLDLIFFIRDNDNDVHLAYKAWAQWVAWRIEYGPEIAAAMRTEGRYDDPITEVAWNTTYTAKRCPKCLQYHSATLGTPRACREGQTTKEINDGMFEKASKMSAYERAEAIASGELSSDINYRSIRARAKAAEKKTFDLDLDEKMIEESKELAASEVQMIAPVLRNVGRWGSKKNMPKSEKRQPRKKESIKKDTIAN